MNIKRYITIPKSLLLKLSSLILGYCVWYALSSNTSVEQTLTIPLYCYNQQENHTVQAPETIAITLKAPRSYMRLIDHNALAAHIDMHGLHEGKNYLCLSHKELLLPQEVTVTHYAPVKIIDMRVS